MRVGLHHRGHGRNHHFMLLRTFLGLIVSAALMANQAPTLTPEQRAEIALALATYQQARAEAAEAHIKAERIRVEVEKLIRTRTPAGYRLNEQLQLEKAEPAK